MESLSEGQVKKIKFKFLKFNTSKKKGVNFKESKGKNLAFGRNIIFYSFSWEDTLAKQKIEACVELHVSLQWNGKKSCQLTFKSPVPVTWSAWTWVFRAYFNVNPSSFITLASLSTIVSTGSIICVEIKGGQTIPFLAIKAIGWSISYNCWLILISNICKNIGVGAGILFEQLSKQEGRISHFFLVKRNQCKEVGWVGGGKVIRISVVPFFSLKRMDVVHNSSENLSSKQILFSP